MLQRGKRAGGGRHCGGATAQRKKAAGYADMSVKQKPESPQKKETTKSFVYIAECADRTLYTGWTTDPGRRIAAHNAGRGAKYTKARRPVQLVYLEQLPDKSSGLSREAQIKKMTAQQKRRLIAGHSPVDRQGKPKAQ